MRGGYLATESSHDTSCCMGSVNNSGITVKDARDTAGSSHSQQTWRGACGLKSAKVVDGGWIRVSFDPWNRSLFQYSSAHRTHTEKTPLPAGKLSITELTKTNERCFVKHGRNE